MRPPETEYKPSPKELDQWYEGAVWLYDRVTDGKRGPVELPRELAQGLADRFLILVANARKNTTTAQED